MQEICLIRKIMTLQRKATLVSSAVATILIIIKLIVGLISGSVAVLASAIDSMLDLIVSAFNYFAVTKSEQPADEHFNYGRGKIEALASVIEGTVITISGFYILYEAIKKAYIGEPTSYLGVSIAVMFVSLILTLALVIFLNFVAKKTNSLVIKSDALHYKTDLYTNGAILFSLFLISLTGISYIDSIAGGIIALYIIYSAYELIKEGVLALMDISLEADLVNNIISVIKEEEKVTNYHHLRTRRSGNTNFVDVHCVFNKEILLITAHDSVENIEKRIKMLDTKSEWIINVHLDPYDDS